MVGRRHNRVILSTSDSKPFNTGKKSIKKVFRVAPVHRIYEYYPETPNQYRVATMHFDGAAVATCQYQIAHPEIVSNSLKYLIYIYICIQFGRSYFSRLSRPTTNDSRSHLEKGFSGEPYQVKRQLAANLQERICGLNLLTHRLFVRI